MAKVLIARANWPSDIATRYMSAYGAQLVEKAAGWGHTVTDLYADQDTLVNFENEIPNNDIFIGIGHGNSTTFTGQKINGVIEVLLKSTVNADLLMNKSCYLASCQTAVMLGPQLVESGCLQYFGYAADFSFVYDPNAYAQGNVLDDPYAQPFMDSALTTGYSLLLGKDPKTIYQDTVDRYTYWWDYWIQQNDPLADDVLTWLNWDRANFTAITSDGIYSKAGAKLSLAELAPIAIPLGAAALLFLLSRGKD